MSRKRPVLVFPAAHHRGGVERIVWEALVHLATQGPVVYVGEVLDPPIDGVEVWKVPTVRRGASFHARFRRSSRDLIAANRGHDDVIVTFGVDCPPGEVCVVNSVHRSWVRQGNDVVIKGVRVPSKVRYLMPRHQALLLAERTYFAGASKHHMVVVSPVVGEDLRAHYGVTGPITVIPNGYSASAFTPELHSTRRAAQRAAWNIGDEQIALLFVANELHRKGFACLLEAVARLHDPRLEIHVVGRAPIDPYADRIRDLGLDARVHYHGSMETGLAHAAADALVLPTQYEAFALTIVEAMASGLPVVTTTVPGAGDLIEHGLSGLLQHDPLDADELAGLIREVSDAGVRERLAAASPEAAAGFDWTTLMSRLDDVIQSAG